MNIGNKIKKYRLNNQWTQDELGQILNVSRSTVSSWEVGRNYPDISTLIEISELFDITVDTLLKEDDQMLKSIEFNTKQKNKFKISLIALSVVSMLLTIFFIFNFLKQPDIFFEKEISTADLESEPFSREEIKEISIKNNIITVTFQSSLESTYYGYFADGGGGEVFLNLYKKKVSDDNSLKYEGTTKINLKSLPKIDKLTVYVK